MRLLLLLLLLLFPSTKEAEYTHVILGSSRSHGWHCSKCRWARTQFCYLCRCCWPPDWPQALPSPACGGARGRTGQGSERCTGHAPSHTCSPRGNSACRPHSTPPTITASACLSLFHVSPIIAQLNITEHLNNYEVDLTTMVKIRNILG